MNIDQFNVSENCRHELQRVGVLDVEEIVEFLEEQSKGQAMIQAGWLKYFSEIVEQMKLLGLWSESMEQTWPEDSMRL